MTRYKAVMIDEEVAEEIKQMFPELSFNKAITLLTRVYKDYDSNSEESSDIVKRLEQRRALEQKLSLMNKPISAEEKQSNEVVECQDK